MITYYGYRASRLKKMAAAEAPSCSVLPRILQTIKTNDGVLFAHSAIVHREMYLGRDLIANNSSSDHADERGYVPVEWWIMSVTEAENEKRRINEGLTSLIVEGGSVLLRDALKVAEQELMGQFSAHWPLTKLLDIGGPRRAPIYSPGLVRTLSLSQEEQEVPPIPCHVHAGKVVQGHLCGHGKTEAYFFPPLNVPPYNLDPGQVKTRLGIKPDIPKEHVLENLRLFGCHDDLYTCLNMYDIHPWETWHIEEKVVHAPGPWLTFEIQRPQDDFNFLAWQLGSPLPEERLGHTKESLQLRGLESEVALLEEGVDWEANTARDFQAKWWKQCEVNTQFIVTTQYVKFACYTLSGLHMCIAVLLD